MPDPGLNCPEDVDSLYPSIPQTECLDIIYNQMHERKHLLLCDPNLIIHLLHTNVNYNYFEFGTLTFQQINGTAMGASFSPTIANIFLSITLNKFLATQPLKPLLLKRYIDDIFVIWPHSSEELNTFLTALNTFHSSLHFTSSYSQTETNFLDITIFKHDTFPYTNTLDTKTYQKPKNLYQYVHYNSAHSRKLYKGIIQGECIRYVRTNSLTSNYYATITLFEQRLLQRGYPKQLINKTMKTITYKERQRYLSPTPPKNYARRPILKCLPPPVFSLLKSTILQNYKTISKYVSHPRFITLGHKTLRNELVASTNQPHRRANYRYYSYTR